MDKTQIYLLLYFSNLAFIATNIYGWIMKEFHVAKPYREHIETLFPAQRLVGLLYLAQLMEIPYLIMMGQDKALFYVNAFSLLFFSSMIVVICEGYFFRHKYSIKRLILHFLPMVIPVGCLLLAAFDVVSTTYGFYRWMFWGVCFVFIYYLIEIVIVQKKIIDRIRDIKKGNNTDDGEFPTRLALRTRWLILPVPLLMFVCLICNDVYIKMGRDILFTFVNVGFLLYTIKPHRRMVEQQANEAIDIEPELSIADDELEILKPSAKDLQQEQTHISAPVSNPKYKLSLERCGELEQQITDKLKKEKIFKNSALTIDILAQLLDSNKSYVSEAINRGQFGSYYAMINHYRVEHAIMLLKKNPNQKIESVSKASGFSSTSVFSQVFKRHTGMSAKQYLLSFKTTAND